MGKSKLCEAKTVEGTKCKNWAIKDSEFCMCHDPKYADDRVERGRKVGLLPKVKMKDIDFESLDDLIVFAKNRMKKIALQSRGISVERKEELLIRWSSFLAPWLEKRDKILEKLQAIEEGRGERTRP